MWKCVESVQLKFTSVQWLVLILEITLLGWNVSWARLERNAVMLSFCNIKINAHSTSHQSVCFMILITFSLDFLLVTEVTSNRDHSIRTSATKLLWSKTFQHASNLSRSCVLGQNLSSWVNSNPSRSPSQPKLLSNDTILI